MNLTRFRNLTKIDIKDLICIEQTMVRGIE